ncbi:hypothetical protein GX586_08060 [bacterium]|nr:hypothetical protein [bacterium]
MASALLTRQEQGIVVFALWRSLAYAPRLAFSLLCIGAGLALQAATGSVLPWCLLVLAGNLLLVVRGYDNRVQYAGYEAGASWEKADRAALDAVIELHRKMRRWDRSALDVTNPLGGVLFALVAVVIGAMIVRGAQPGGAAWMITGVNAAILIVPHWVTGIRSILTKPALVIKIDTINAVTAAAAAALAGATVEYFMLLKGKETKLPDDVKIRVKLPEQREGFLGLYGQVVTNTVQGTTYPYFYTVLVAKKGFGLRRAHERYTAPEGVTAEYSEQEDVEVFVIRQTTTKTSGYHTKPAAAARLLGEGVLAARGAFGS